MNDAQLLQSFAEHNSEAAFRTLVERHLPLVFGTARRMTGDTTLAEDIAQTVFILLARKANRLGRDVILSGWLYRSTRFVTSRALTAERRRRRREQEAVTMQPSTSSEPSWLRSGPQLDDALARLGDIDRNAILLRYFEQQSLRDVGLSLGLNEEAAKKRIARALEKLKRMLSRRGVEISAVALAAGLTKEAAEAASVLPLAGKISAVVFAHGAAGAGAAAGSALLTNVLAALRWAKIINVTAAVVAVIALAFILPQVARYGQSSAISPAAATDSPTLVSRPASKNPAIMFAAKSGRAAGSFRTMTVTVLDAKTGKPIQGATLSPYVNGVFVPEFRDPFHTDSNGVVRLPIHDNVPGGEQSDYCEIPINAPGYVTRIMRWYSRTGMVINAMSNQPAIQLSRGVSLSGIVVDNAGKPMANIHVGATGNNCVGGTTPGYHEVYSSFGLPAQNSPVVTDPRGHFKLEHFPGDVRPLEIDLLSADGSLHKFQTPEGFSIHAETLPQVSLSDLKNGIARLVIAQGVNVHGIVVDNAGVPIAGADVMEATEWGNLHILSKIKTDSSGAFCLSNRPMHEIILGASAEGSASLSAIVSIRPGMEQVRLQLPPELPLRGQVVNEAGLPVPNALLTFVDFLSPGQCQNWQDTTGTDGRFQWTNAPTNEVALAVSASGYSSCVIKLRASTNESVLTLHSGKRNSPRLTGNVTDADSVTPLKNFQIDISPQNPGKVDSIDGSNGVIDITLSQKDFPIGIIPSWTMSIEAEGYETSVSREYYFEEGDQQLDFKMERGGSMEGVVRTPAGDAAAEAKFAFTVHGDGPLPSTEPGQFLDAFQEPEPDSGPNGSFKLRKPARARKLVVLHDSGWAVIAITNGAQNSDIQLSPWGRVEGTLTIDNQPAANRDINVKNLASEVLDPLNIYYKTTTGNDGHFIFDKMPAGTFKISCSAARWNIDTLQTPVTVAAGETKTVNLTASGRTVTAQLQAPDGFASINWLNAVATLSADVQVPPEPVRNDFITEEAMHAAHVRYTQDPSVLAALGRQQTLAGSVNIDGTTVFQQVPPGSYILEIKLLDPSELPSPPNFDKDPAVVLTRLRAAVTVPEITDPANNAGPLALGDFILEKP